MVRRAAPGPRRRRRARLSQAPRHRARTTIARFGLGLAPDSRTALKRALAQLGEDKLVETGMLIQPEEGGKEPYDRFRGRLMIPIRDPRGRVIAFGGRILGDGEPKYLNSPDTPLFDKGRTLYNIDRAAPGQPHRQAADRRRRLYGRDRARPRRHRRGRRAQRHRASPKPSSSACGGSIPRRSCASTATAPGARPRSAPHCAPCPCIGPERTLRFVELPAGPGSRRRRPRRRHARRSRRCSPGPSRSTPACGGTSSKPSR